MPEPVAIAGDGVEREKRAGHCGVVAEERSGDVVRVVAEAAIGQSAIAQHPLRRASGRVEILAIAGGGIQSGQRGDHPSVFPRVFVSIDSRHAEFAPSGVIQREVTGTVLSFHQVGVLAGVKNSFPAGEKRFDVSRNLGCRMQILRVAPLDVAQRINPQIFRLHLHDFFEMRCVPVAVGGILVHPAPGGIEQAELGVQSLPGHLLGIFVTALRQIDGIFHRIPIQVFLVESPAAVGAIVSRQKGSLKFGLLLGSERGFRRVNDW